MAENRLDFYEKVLVDGNKEADPLSPLVDFDTEDTYIYRVHAFAANRPDMISYMHYGSVDLWWLICMHNEIENPYTDLPTGTELIIPSLQKYYNYYNTHSKVDTTPKDGYDNRKV